MNIELRQPVRAPKTRYGIVDCDIHPKLTPDDMRPHLSNQWWSHLQTYGLRPRHGFAKTYPMPKITPQAARRDAWPPSGDYRAATSTSCVNNCSTSTTWTTAS